MYRVRKLSTASALVDVEVPVPGRAVLVLRTAGLTGVSLKVDDKGADVIPLDVLSGWESPEPWQRLYVTAPALAGGELTLIFSDDLGVLPGIDSGVFATARDALGRLLLSAVVGVNPVAGMTNNAVGLRGEGSANGVAYPLGVVPMLTDGAGALVGQRAETIYQPFAVAPGAGAASTIWTPGAGKKIRLMGIAIASSANTAPNLRMGTAGAGTTRATIATTTQTATVPFGNGILATAINQVLEVFNGAGGPITFWGTAWGTEES